MFEKLRERVKAFCEEKIKDEREAEIFKKCFFNTLDTTCQIQTDRSVFVITGDIPAMWLRDSTGQVLQYLFFSDDEEVRALIKGVIKRQMKYLITDTYANAFMLDASKASEWDGRYITERWARILWERKYELDSLCYPLFLAAKYYENTKDYTIFDNEFIYSYDFVYQTFIIEREHASRSDYRNKYWLQNEFVGDGVSVESEKGLIWTGYRPSDDKCEYGYHIPDNMFVASVMKKFYRIFNEIADKQDFLIGISDRERRAREIEKTRERAEDCLRISEDLRKAIEENGITEVSTYGKVYAYETDCMGRYALYDDANVPSLLSIPYLEYPYVDEKVYSATRKFVLSKANKYYYEGKKISGVGSPHTLENRVWPMSVIMRGITSNDANEIKECYNMLINSTDGTGYMHESVNKDDDSLYSRSWFAWANSLFAFFVLLKQEIIF